MNDLFFSVVIPLYNKEKYIAETIQSVLRQTYANFEIVVINDGSTDQSAETVKCLRDDRIRLIDQENQGVSVARNNGIKAAKNNWIAFLDGDDKWERDFLAEIKNAISLDSNFIGYATGYKKQDMQGNIYYPKLKKIPHERGKLNNYFLSSFFGNPIITSSSICLNKALLDTNNILNLFPPNIKRGEDLDAWTKLNLKNNIFFINKPLVTIKNVDGNTSNQQYRIDQSFNYNLWLNYKTNSKKKKFYILLLVMKREFGILKRLLRNKQYKDVPELKDRLLGKYK
ncbi:glycosyl transferase family 2 [Flexistipes sinusarabici DSM 4947]|uniref:Glycosyl transferase family 2 n=1 Tax=Flexistipes sinusarabici (strain ATCC 49648 / DSM 4947 / MAS 10) TaxID=717231 RepID=F8E8J5_FLESM|nr:glycosyltransferase family 2 protein [Flexistipes sinusarabici]AEI14044.1 glycosyl transferase family 2 [Flexistipes sinusarabici DSM 4947]